jgi:NlpC/P60 family
LSKKQFLGASSSGFDGAACLSYNEGLIISLSCQVKERMGLIKAFLALLVFSISTVYAEVNAEQIFYSNVIHVAKDSIGLQYIPSWKGKHFTSDCIGFIDYVYARAGLDLEKAYGSGRGGVSSLYDGLEKRKFTFQAQIASPGDLIFFDNTYDINRNGKWDDPLSHIAIVSGIGRHNTLFYIHFSGYGVVEERMNLYYSNTHAFRQQDGTLFVINSFLRRDRGEGFDKKQYVASSFYRAFAHIPVKTGIK